MISWIVATNNVTVLDANLLATLNPPPEDELIVIEDAPSITVAYAEGQAKASKPIRCYVHSDVQVRSPTLREQLIDYTTAGVGLVGLVGSLEVRMPWWDGHTLGSVVDARMGELHFGPGGDCSILDGLLLATAHDVDWDTDWPGWHGYDHDACTQMLRRGLTNYCLSEGHELVLHNTTGTRRVDREDSWNDAMRRYREKWGG